MRVSGASLPAPARPAPAATPMVTVHLRSPASFGRPMSTRYAQRLPYYECAASRADRTVTPGRRSVRSATIDDAVTAALMAACEPENRPVARGLESRWETRLGDLAAAENHRNTQPRAQTPLPPPAQLAAALEGMRTLWEAPTTRDKDRKGCCGPCWAMSPSPRAPTATNCGWARAGVRRQPGTDRPTPAHRDRMAARIP
jgi:hypothetical protein